LGGVSKLTRSSSGKYEFAQMFSLVDLGEIRGKFFQVNNKGELTSVIFKYHAAKDVEDS